MAVCLISVSEKPGTAQSDPEVVMRAWWPLWLHVTTFPPSVRLSHREAHHQSRSAQRRHSSLIIDNAQRCKSLLMNSPLSGAE